MKKSRTRLALSHSKARALAVPKAARLSSIRGPLKAGLRLFQSHTTRYLRAKATLDRNASRRTAALAFRNSKKLNAGALADPMLVSRFVEARIAAHPEALGPVYAKAEHRIDRATAAAEIAAILAARDRVIKLPQPRIQTWFTTVFVDTPTTVTGLALRDCRLSLKTDDGKDLRPQILSRSDTAITFKIPKQTGIAFHTPATLGVMLFGVPPRPLSDCVHVIVEPFFRYWCSWPSYSDEGFNAFGYEEDVYLMSQWLPPYYALANTWWCDAPGVHLSIDNLIVTTAGCVDMTGDAAIASFVGPYVVPEMLWPFRQGERRLLAVKVKVTGDNHYQDFVLVANMFICVPLGYSAGSWEDFGIEAPPEWVPDVVRDVSGG